jgi:hypothetical protein
MKIIAFLTAIIVVGIGYMVYQSVQEHYREVAEQQATVTTPSNILPPSDLSHSNSSPTITISSSSIVTTAHAHPAVKGATAPSPPSASSVEGLDVGNNPLSTPTPQ